VKAAGSDVRVVYSPLDCLKIAEQNPDRTVVFFAVGFETTAPANALVVQRVRARAVTNFAVLVSHVLVPPAMGAILAAPANRVRGSLAAGHVCTVMGTAEYEPLAALPRAGRRDRVRTGRSARRRAALRDDTRNQAVRRGERLRASRATGRQPPRGRWSEKSSR
jgi:hypothetical protein